MNHRERILAVLRGERPDRPPVALWRHFPEADGDAENQAQAHLDFQARHGFDILKVTPASGYFGDDWGLEGFYRPNPEGVRTYTRLPIGRRSDWRKLAPLDPRSGAWGREIKAVRRILKGAGKDVPVIETVFSPLTAARTLAGEEALLLHLREDGSAVHAGLKAIAETARRFVTECLAAGADGIFFATQMARDGLTTPEEYEEFGRPYDLEVLSAARGSGIVILHLHGEGSRFDRFLDYPAHAINWHDRRTSPTLGDALEMFDGCVAGGIDESRFAERKPEEIAAEVRAAIRDTGGIRHIVAPGCVIPVDAPEENIRAAISAV
jgi:uroporphyrinogen decarboxylase